MSIIPFQYELTISTGQQDFFPIHFQYFVEYRSLPASRRIKEMEGKQEKEIRNTSA